jgi:hypothetical protein
VEGPEVDLKAAGPKFGHMADFFQKLGSHMQVSWGADFL